VRTRTVAKNAAPFGLLIPDLGETEIFEPICNGIAGAPRVGPHALLWGSIEPTQDAKEAQALKLCLQFIERRVSGVFFAPLELTPTKDETNHAIIQPLRKLGFQSCCLTAVSCRSQNAANTILWASIIAAQVT